MMMEQRILPDHTHQLPTLPSIPQLYKDKSPSHDYHTIHSPDPSPFSLPKPDSGRLPVRLGLSDPRVHLYLNPSKSMSAPTPDRSQDHFPRQDRKSLIVPPQSRIPHITAPGTSSYLPNSYPSTGSSRYHHPSYDTPTTSRPMPTKSLVDNSQSIRRDFELYGPPASSPQRSHFSHAPPPSQGSMSRASTVPSASPSPLPSPTPSATRSPDWHHSYNRHIHSHPHYSNIHHHQQHHESPLDLLSPSSSEVDLGSDVKTLPPLFPANSPPMFAGEFQHSSRLSPQPTQGAFNSSYARSSGVRNPSLDLRAHSPLSTLPWKSHQPHQKLPPIRAPERAGQDVIRTSSLDTTSSEYLNMDYYSIYRQNPRLLRPEGGRFDEKRHTRTHSDDVALVGESSHPMTHAPSKSSNKPRPRMSCPGSMGNNGMSRRQSMPLISTGTSRVLRHEDARMEPSSKYSHEHDHDIVRSLGIHSAAATRPTATSHNRPTAMSIHNLLTDSYEDMAQSDGGVYQHDSSSFGNDSESETGTKRKKSHGIMGDETDGEPKKRRRMSKKRAAELGLLDSDGNVIKKRKRTKKVHDPDHVSPSGFRHGGERTVQEPEEVVHLSPDVGPVSMLDVKQPPMVIWKGQALSVVGKPGYELLHPHEARIASTLRLSPAQYLNCKQTLILASRSYYSNPDGKQFRKSDAQKLCRIDVNKTSRLWEVFAKIGWLAGITERDI